MRQIFLDTETTGTRPDRGDRVVEIGCLEMVSRKLTRRQFHTYLNPECEMPEEAFRIHGLSQAFLADKPRFAEQAKDLVEFVADSELIIHNAAFDMAFLNAELARLKMPALDTVVHGVIDTLALARQQFPGKRASLDALCDRLGVDRTGRTLHGALLDAGLLCDVYIALTRGQESLIGEASGPQAHNVGEPSIVIPADLFVLHASVEELQAHATILQQIDKESKGQTVWKVAA